MAQSRLRKTRRSNANSDLLIPIKPYIGDRSHATWYEPLTDQASIDNAVHWVLGNEDVFLNTAGDIGILPLVLDAAQRFQARTPEPVMQEMVAEWEMAPLFV